MTKYYCDHYCDMISEIMIKNKWSQTSNSKENDHIHFRETLDDDYNNILLLHYRSV
jgi:hypothetical protein